MSNEPASKKARTEGDGDEDGFGELVHAVWEHYRNYLDSAEEEDEEGSQDADIDEIQELIEIAKGRIAKPSPSSEFGMDSVEIVCPAWKSRQAMLPILLSVACFHLADGAISQYLLIQQEEKQASSSSPMETEGGNDDPGTAESRAASNALENAQNLLIESLEWYPFNAATWSMGANFGRMSKSLSLSSCRNWYEMAVRASVVLREQALVALEDDGVPSEEKEWIELLVLNQIVGVEYEGDDDPEEEGQEEDGDATNTDGSKKADDDGDESEKKSQSDGRDEEGEVERTKPDYPNTADGGDESEKKGEPQEDDGDEEADVGWYSASAVESTARFMCAMLWSMDGRHDRALAHLKPFRLTHRLYPEVWRISPPQSKAPSPPVAPTVPPLVFQPSEGIVPSKLYDAMTKVFAPDAAFWKESNYSTRGYYSFFHDFDGAAAKKQPCNLIEEVIINHLLPRAQQCLDNMAKSDGEKSNSCDDSNTIRGFEWWAHTRPIQANLGHNLHFDTDESILDQEGKVKHPVLSSVLYLTGGQGGSENFSSPAGATIILDETPDSTTVGKACWQCIPKDNSFLVFPGNRLHGVLPCPGIRTKDKQPSSDESKSIDVRSLIHDWENQKKQEPSPTEDLPHRLTFMVGFWTRNVPATMKHRHLYGPCGPLPPATEEHTWMSEITQGYRPEYIEQRPVADKTMDATALPQVSPAWEVIGTAKEDEEERYPTIPQGIDHRFFVDGAPHCFRRSLFEDRVEVNDF